MTMYCQIPIVHKLMNMNNQWFALQRQCIHTTILPKDTQRPFTNLHQDQVEIKGQPKCPTTYTCTYIHMYTYLWLSSPKPAASNRKALPTGTQRLLFLYVTSGKR
jgi:hypothetical protein